MAERPELRREVQFETIFKNVSKGYVDKEGVYHEFEEPRIQYAVVTRARGDIDEKALEEKGVTNQLPGMYTTMDKKLDGTKMKTEYMTEGRYKEFAERCGFAEEFHPDNLKDKVGQIVGKDTPDDKRPTGFIRSQGYVKKEELNEQTGVKYTKLVPAKKGETPDCYKSVLKDAEPSSFPYDRKKDKEVLHERYKAMDAAKDEKEAQEVVKDAPVVDKDIDDPDLPF